MCRLENHVNVNLVSICFCQMKFNVLYCLVSGSALSDAHSDAIIVIVIGRLTSGDKVRICVERSKVEIKYIHIF